MSHQQFSAILRTDPSDIHSWLVYADWLENQGDQTGNFIRLSLELTAGRSPIETTAAGLAEYKNLYTAAHPWTRQLMATYRSSLPARFRVLESFFIGEDPPMDMFGYAQTVAVGFLESGRIKVGMDLGVGIRGDGEPLRLQGISAYKKECDELAAGREPIEAGLGWIGHIQIEAGRVLTGEMSL